MTEFHNIAQAVAFTSHEIALFHALSHSWNVARRPAVIEQWAEITSRNAGLTKKRFFISRNRLIESGIVYHRPGGAHKMHGYSLNALFGLERPAGFPDPSDSLTFAPEPTEAQIRRNMANRFIGDPSVRSVIFIAADHKCQACGSDQNLSVDHIIPVSKGGGDEMDNLQCLCLPCNRSRSNNLKWKGRPNGR